MKITVPFSLAACAAAMVLGAGLSGCSHGNTVAPGQGSLAQQSKAVGQMSSQTKDVEQQMLQRVMASREQQGSSAAPPQVAPPNIGAH